MPRASNGTAYSETVSFTVTGGEINYTTDGSVKLGNITITVVPLGNEKCETCSYVSVVETEAKALEAGVMRYTCSVCGDTYTEEIPATDTLKVLAVGNSFSIDSMHYLYDVATDAGVDNVELGILYRGGATLEEHASGVNALARSTVTYDYYKNTSGEWTVTSGYTIGDALADGDWDIVTMQQACHASGRSDSFVYVDESTGETVDYMDVIANYITANEPGANIMWNMTWAFPDNTTNGWYEIYYNSDQTAMYNAILGCVNDIVLTKDYIKGVIPTGTAIQNLRGSYLGDTLNRDDLHLTYDLGRYAAALTWFEYLTGGSVETVDFIPEDYPELAYHLDAMKHAANAAVATPYAVTQSPYTVEPEIPVTRDNDRTKLASLGYDIDEYSLLEWTPTISAFYSSISSHDLFVGTEQLHKKYLASPKFNKSDIPVGSVIIVDEGFMYRPEGWKDGSTLTSSADRPDEVTATVTVVDDAWWGDFTIRGFNLKHTTEYTLTTEDAEHLRIYVPNPDAAVFEANSLDIGNYSAFDWEPELNTFYNSTVKTAGEKYTTADAAESVTNRFASSTDVFTKDDLPVGTVIIIDQYTVARIDGWANETDLMTDATRPAEIITKDGQQVIIVDEAWWEGYTYRAINTNTYDGSNVTEDYCKNIRIYVPNADKAVFEANDLYFDDYELFDWQPELNTFYKSTAKAYPSKYTTADAAESVTNRFASSTGTFTADDIPVDSVIIIDAKTIARFDGWANATDLMTDATRPAEIIASSEQVVVVVDETWWEGLAYRVVNTNTYDGSNITEEYCENIRIYVPKN